MSGDQKEPSREFHIRFDAPLSARNNPRWPNNYRVLFRHIRQIGNADLKNYQEGTSADLLYNPWKERVALRAKRIARLAKRYMQRQGEDDGDEDGWNEVERVVLARFSVEVACRKCSARFWRAEVETDARAPSGHVQVENRQCCPGEQDNREFCTRSLFDSTIVPPDAATQPRGQRRELAKANRYKIYGLRKTHELSPPLDGREPDGSHSHSDDAVADSALPTYPFLLIEDAADRNEMDGAAEVGMEIASVLRQLLKLQYALQSAVDNVKIADWTIPPLVWLISRRAEQWSLHAGYIEKKRGTTDCRVFRLWKGCLDRAEDAFRLLMYIDYIVDCAREIHREDITRVLKYQQIIPTTKTSPAADGNKPSGHGEAAETPASTTHAGPEVKRGRRPEDIPRKDAEVQQDALRAFDTPLGALRDARYIRSRFIGLYVTEDNFTILMQSAASADESKKLAASILNCLKEAWRVRRDALDMIEAIWTDTDRLGLDAYPPDKAFLAVFTVAAYFAPDWEQTREMGYLAVAETLVDALLDAAGQHRFPGEEGLGAPFMETDDLGSAFTSILKNTAERNVLGCAARACWETGISPSPGGHKTGLVGDGSFEDYGDWGDQKNLILRPVCVEHRDGKAIHRLDVAIKPSSQTPRVRNLIFGLYRRHKVGRNEPSSSLFRISDYLDVLGSPEQLLGEGMRHAVIYPFPVWPIRTSNFPGDEDQGFVLVAAPTDEEPVGRLFPGQAGFCILATSPEAARAAAADPDALLQSVKAGWHLEAKRFDRTSSRGGTRSWNVGLAAGSDFVNRCTSRQEVLAAKLAAYVEHLKPRAVAAQGHEIGVPGTVPADSSSSEPEQPLRFWRPNKPRMGRHLTSTAVSGKALHVLDVMAFAELLPHSVRLRTVSWKEPAGRHLIIRKDEVRRTKDGRYKWTNPKAPASTDSESDGGDDSAGDGSRHNKRPTDLQAGPSSSKRPRLSPAAAAAAESSRRAEALSSSSGNMNIAPASQGSFFEPQDWATDEDFQLLLQQGTFA